MAESRSTPKEWGKLLLEKAVRLCIKMASPFFRMRPQVIFVAYKRKGYCDNLKYIADALLREQNPPRIVWATQYPDTTDEVRAKGVEVVRLTTVRYILQQLRSKMVVYNDCVPPYMPKRKGQVYLNAWHGGMNFKHIGYDWLANQSPVALAKFALANPQPDYYLSGSEFFTRDTAASFRFDPSVFLPWGLPRNDILFDTDSHPAIADKVHETLGLDDEVRLALYAPTFRNDFASDTHGLDTAGLCSALAERFGGRWVVAYRGHYFVEGQAALTGAVDATDYGDMQEMLIAADVLVSDYSSAMWDMAFLRRPVFCYAPDFERYRDSERAFACPPERWPYRIAKTNEELAASIARFDEASYYPDVERFLAESGSYEQGNCAPRVARLIVDVCKGEKV